MAEQDLEDEIVFEKDGELKGTEDQIGELLKTKERTPEQEKELSELKKKRQGRYDERLRELTAAKHKEADRAARAEARAEELAKQLESRKSEQEFQPRGNVNRERTNINGKSFYTDKALQAMVQANEMSQDEAWQHQQERIEEKAVSRLKTERQQEDAERSKQDEIKWALDKYPKFNPQHRDHNPNDPVFREATRLLNNGYRSIKQAIEDAEEKLGKNGSRPDLSDELSVTQTNSASEASRRAKVAELSEDEIELAERLYVYGGRTNPKTGKIYTKKEAVQKAMEVKSTRVNLAKR